MCGIVGITSKKQFSSSYILNMLKRLEYRGYDSFGFATPSGKIEKFVGEIDLSKINDISDNTAISHTRWATHGGVFERNAHPHSDCKNDTIIVHNGIVENFSDMRKEMEKAGHKFTSDTDSEVIAHFFEGRDINDAVPEFFAKVKGDFSVLLMKKGENRIYAFKRGSPLVLGVSKDSMFLASDVYAFCDVTNKAIFFNEDEFAIISPDGYEFFHVNDQLVPQKKEEVVFSWESRQSSKKNFEHFMIKEISEEPEVAQRLLFSLGNDQKDRVKELASLIKESKRVVFVAAGTSYHASLLGVYLLTKTGIEAHSIIASEFRNFSLVDENTLIIAVSQSGETMDVIQALKGMKKKGAKIASIVNVPYSTIQRMSNISVEIMAGQEVCVAATKTFVNQTLTFMYLASLFGYPADLENIPSAIQSFIKENDMKKLALSLKDARDIYIIGRGFSYPVSREIALKLKEISYIHAEGMMGGELKHGTLALIEKGTPVITLIPKDDNHIISNAKEVEARGGRVIAFEQNNSGFESVKINANCEGGFAILSTVAGQLLTYYISREKGLPIDKPRNLAKTVTVK